MVGYLMCVISYTGDTLRSKRVQVVFTNPQWDLIEKFRGEFGNGDAEIIRNIVLAWLAEKSMISTTVKMKL